MVVAVVDSVPFIDFDPGLYSFFFRFEDETPLEGEWLSGAGWHLQLSTILPLLRKARRGTIGRYDDAWLTVCCIIGYRHRTLPAPPLGICMSRAL